MFRKLALLLLVFSVGYADQPIPGDDPVRICELLQNQIRQFCSSVNVHFIEYDLLTDPNDKSLKHCYQSVENYNNYKPSCKGKYVVEKMKECPKLDVPSNTCYRTLYQDDSNSSH